MKLVDHQNILVALRIGVISTARSITVLVAFIALAAPALAQSTFDPRAYQSHMVGEPTQVLVLGSPHLSGTPEGWDPVVLEPLLVRLAAFRPDLITTEDYPGPTIFAMWQYRAADPSSARPSGARGRVMMLSAAGSAGTGMDMAEAEGEAGRMLRTWPVEPTAAQRRQLAALFATAGDPYSALVQWWRLDAAERKVGDGINAPLLAQLGEYERRKSESQLIGSRLATRLGLERVFGIDAPTDDVMTPEQIDIFMRELFNPIVEQLKADPRFRPVMESAQRMGTPEETLATYRLANQPEIGQLQAELEWRATLDRPTTQDVGRMRLAAWEVRNLRMVANIRHAMAANPGGRVLVIVGAGHKQWFEAYLGMLPDVQLVDAQAVLR